MTALNTLTNDSGERQIKQAISEVANKYGIKDAGLSRLIECESNFKTEIYGDNGKAFSLMQFHKPTFETFCDGNYYSAKDQIICGSKMIKNNLGSHWTCIWAYLSN